MALLVFIALQLAATAVALALLWRRSERQRQEIAALQNEIELLRAPRRARHDNVALAAVTPAQRIERVSTDAWPAEPTAPHAWRLPAEVDQWLASLPVSAATLRGATMAVVATAPGFGFFAHLDPAWPVATGIVLAAAMMLLSLRREWRPAAWGAVLTGGAWALIGFALSTAHAEPGIYCTALPVAAAAGLAHAYMRRAAHGANVALAPGATLALLMSAAALALGSQIGMIAAPGAAFAVIVSCAAIAGALNIKLEPIHLAAFGATLIGLFVMSGQQTAAIWFTPITAWAGALFLGIAAVRVPKTGARGAALAATGVIAPLTSIAALYGAGQGLSDPRAAATAFALLAALFGVIIIAAARWRGRGLAALKMSIWLLGGGVFLGATAAIFLPFSPPFAAPAFALLALGYVHIERRAPNTIWRASAVMAMALAGANAWASAELMLREAPNLGPRISIGAGLAAPALIGAIAGRIATRNKMTLTAGALEGASIAIGMAAASLGVRYYFSGGAPLLHPPTFVEGGAHISVWLIAAILIAARSRRDVRKLRAIAATVLGVMALLGSAIISVLWLTDYWDNRPESAAPAPFQHEPLGFALPAIFFFCSWVFWRARGSNLRTRLAFGAAALMGAGFVTLESMHPGNGETPGTLHALIGALSFAFAIALNFAPGVAPGSSRRAYFEESVRPRVRREERKSA